MINLETMQIEARENVIMSRVLDYEEKLLQKQEEIFVLMRETKQIKEEYSEFINNISELENHIDALKLLDKASKPKNKKGKSNDYIN